MLFCKFRPKAFHTYIPFYFFYCTNPLYSEFPMKRGIADSLDGMNFVPLPHSCVVGSCVLDN